MRSLRRALLIGSALLGAAVFWLALGEEVGGQSAPAGPAQSAADDPPWKRVLAGDDAKRVAELQRESFELQKAAKYAEAQTPWRTILHIRTRVQGAEHWQTTDARRRLQTLEQIAALPADARAEFAEATKLPAEVGRLQQKGRYADTLPLLNSALDIRRRHLGEEHAEVAMVRNDLVFILLKLGRFAEAEVQGRQALKTRREVLGIEHPGTATSYTNLAMSLNSQGRYAEAGPLLAEALTIYRWVVGEDHPLTVICYNNLAGNLKGQGKYAEAELLFRRVLEIHLQRHGQDHADTAVSFGNLAGTLSAQGKLAEAEALYRRALEIHCKEPGEDHPATAHSYNQLAINLSCRGKYADAEPLFRKALAIRSKVLSEKHPDSASSCRALANTLLARGEHADAEVLFRKALAIHRRALGEEHPVTGISYNNLAGSLVAQGKYAEAEEVMTAAAKSFEVARLRVSSAGLERAAFGTERSPLLPLAACLARLGRAGEAWKRLEEALARGLLDEWSARLVQPRDADRQKHEQDLLGKIEQLDQEIIALLGAREPAEAHYLREKGLQEKRRLLQAELAQLAAAAAARQVYSLDRIQAQLPADAALLAWIDFPSRPGAVDPGGEHWACLLRRSGPPVWVKLQGTGPDGAWTPGSDQLIDRVRQALGKRLGEPGDDWKEQVKELSGQRLVPLEKHLRGGEGVPEVKHLVVLPSARMAGIPVEALTDQYTVSYAPSATIFAKLQEKRQEAAKKQEKPSPVRLLALGGPVFQPPDTVNKPPPDHGALVAQVAPRSNADRSGVKAGDVLLRYAGSKVLGPTDFATAVRQTGASKPDSGPGEKTGIPVEVWREGKTLELTARPDLSGVTINPKPAAEVIRARRERDALVRGTMGPAFDDLPGTRREVNAIGQLFAHADTLLGSDASAQRLAELAAANRLKDYRYLHLATHGVMDNERHLMSALILAQDKLPDQLEQVLAGKEPDDDQLTAKRILETWKLDAELVTLSACQTGLGRLSGGEGYVGFTQALFLAGARSLVLSLWKVNDVATALLMTRFYENLLGARKGEKPMPKALALKEAKHWLRSLTNEEIEKLEARLPPVERGKERDRPAALPRTGRRFEHPYYWSAFILIGDPN